MTTSQRWTMLAAILGSSMVFLDGTIVNLALPHDRAGAAGQPRLDARGPDLRRRRLPRDPRRAADPRRRPRRLLRPAPRVRHRPRRLRRSRRSCAASRRRSSCSSSPGCSRARPARCSSRGRSRSSPRCSTARRAPRAFGIWAAAPSATTLSGRSLGGLLVDAVSWRAAFLINVPARRARPYATLRHVEESRGERRDGSLRLAGRRGRGPRGRRARVRGDPRPGAATGRIPWRGPRSPSAPSRSSRSRSSWRGGPTRSSRSGLFRRRALRDHQPLDAADLRRRCTRWLPVPGPVPAERPRLHGDRRRPRRAADGSLLIALLSARVGARSGRIGSRPFLIAGPAAHGRGPAVAGADPGDDASPGCSRPATRRRYLPPVSVLVDVLPYVAAVRASGFVAGRGAAHGDADVVGAGVERRRLALGDQQRDQPGRAAAALGGDLRRDLGHVLRDARGVGPRRSTRPIPRCGRWSSR